MHSAEDIITLPPLLGPSLYQLVIPVGIFVCQFLCVTPGGSQEPSHSVCVLTQHWTRAFMRTAPKSARLQYNLFSESAMHGALQSQPSWFPPLALCHHDTRMTLLVRPWQQDSSRHQRNAPDSNRLQNDCCQCEDAEICADASCTTIGWHARAVACEVQDPCNQEGRAYHPSGDWMLQK